jgi:hypothetical protein
MIVGSHIFRDKVVVRTPIGSDEAANKQYVLDNAGTPPSISVIPSRDHSQLTSLVADDHTQYHNNVRGDARYYTQAQIDALIAAISPPVAWDSIVIVIRHFIDASAGPQTVNLPASAVALNQFHVVKKTDDTANTVTAVPDGSDTVEGDAGLILENQGDAANLLINGTNWEVV